MKWVRNYAWVAVPVLLLVYFVWLRPPRGPNPRQVTADLEAQRAAIEKELADREARRAELDRKLDQLRTESTLQMLRLVGDAYRGFLDKIKKPPQAADFGELVGEWKSARDEQPFEIVWGVDRAKLPNGGVGHLLAWEKMPGPDGSRCVLMADAKTAKVVTAAEFEALPGTPAGLPETNPKRG